MARTVLGISWLNGDLKAVAFRGGQVMASWSSPVPVKSVEDLASALQQAARETGACGSKVIAVLDSRDVTHYLQETPPGKRGAILRLLERLVAKKKSFSEEPVWSHRPVPAGRNQYRFLLTVMPRSTLDGLNHGCCEAGLTLTGVFAPDSVLHRHLPDLPVRPNESVLLVADLGESVYLLAGRGDGQILFSRSVPMMQGPDPTRAVQEINRTLLFVQQQFGVVVSQCWLYGETARRALGELNLREGVTVQTRTMADEPFSLARDVALLSKGNPGNLLSRIRPPQEGLSRRMKIGAVVSLISAVALIAAIESTARVQARERSRLAAEGQRLAARQDQALARERKQAGMLAFLRASDPAENPPLAEIFLRYLSAIAPTNLTFTSASLQHGDQGWTFRLEGQAPIGVSAFLQTLEVVETNLTFGLLQVRLTDSTRRRLLDSPSLGNASTGSHRSFFVEGVIP